MGEDNAQSGIVACNMRHTVGQESFVTITKCVVNPVGEGSTLLTEETSYLSLEGANEENMEEDGALGIFWKTSMRDKKSVGNLKIRFSMLYCCNGRLTHGSVVRSVRLYFLRP